MCFPKSIENWAACDSGISNDSNRATLAPALPVHRALVLLAMTSDSSTRIISGVHCEAVNVKINLAQQENESRNPEVQSKSFSHYETPSPVKGIEVTRILIIEC